MSKNQKKSDIENAVNDLKKSGIEIEIVKSIPVIAEVKEPKVNKELNPFQVMNQKLDEVWLQYWKVREVTDHNDPFQKKRALEFENNFRECKRAIFDLSQV